MQPTISGEPMRAIRNSAPVVLAVILAALVAVFSTPVAAMAATSETKRVSVDVKSVHVVKTTKRGTAVLRVDVLLPSGCYQKPVVKTHIRSEKVGVVVATATRSNNLCVQQTRTESVLVKTKSTPVKVLDAGSRRTVPVKGGK